MEEHPPVSNEPTSTEPIAPQTTLPPQPAAAQQPIVGATVKTKRKISKKVRMIFIILLLAAIGAAVYFFVIEKDTLTTNNSNNQSQQINDGTPTTFAPRFTTVDSFVEFESSKWYAATGAVIKTPANDSSAESYSNAQGVPIGTPNSLVIHNGQLWVSTMKGVAVYNKASNNFISSKDGVPGNLSNGKLFYDASAKKLYLNDFTSFYVYNDQSKKFETVTGPSNVQSFAANDSFVAVYSAANPDWPIWVLNKKTGVWAKSTPSYEEQSYRVANVSGKLIILGRTKGYSSCEQTGKITATSAYYMNDQGVWTPFTAFNADKARAELTILNSPRGQLATVKTQSCGGGGTEKQYTLAAAGTELTLTNEKTISDASTFNNPTEEAALITTLSKATKLHPATTALAVDGVGNVIFAFTDSPDASSTLTYTGFAVAKQNVLGDATVIDTSSIKETVITPILCGVGKNRKLAYLFSGKQHIATGGQEGFPDGTWSSAKLYTVTNDKISEFKDLGPDVATPTFACTGTELVWLGTTGLNKLSIDTKNVAKIGAIVGSNLGYTTTTAKETPNNSLWFGTRGPDSSIGSGTLYYYDATKSTYNTVASKTDITNITAASDTYAVIHSTQAKASSNTVYDTTGKKIQTLPADNAPIVNGATNDDFVLLQFAALGTNSIYQSFTINKLKVGAPPTALAAHNNAYTSLYPYGDNGFGLNTLPLSVFDASRNQYWLNDSVFGVNVIKLP